MIMGPRYGIRHELTIGKEAYHAFDNLVNRILYREPATV